MIKRKSVLRSVCAGVAVLAVTLAGCSGAPPTPAGQGQPGGKNPILQVYRGASGQFVENYNPFSPTVLNDVNGLIYEALFYFNDQAPLGTAPVPVLGKTYEFDPTGKILSVTLQDGVKWSDGTPFTAKDVVYTFDTIRKNPSLDRTGNAPVAKATGDNQVTLTFAKPSFSDGPSILGTSIVPEHTFSKMKDVATDTNKDPVGTGPMTVDTFSAQSYLFKKSDTFRAAADVVPPGLRYFSLSGNEAATNKLIAGELDWAGIFIPDIEKVLKPFPDLKIQSTAFQPTVLTTCSNAKLGCKGPQTSPAVRQAMSAAINREQVTQLAWFGRGKPVSPTFALPDRDEQFQDPKYPALPLEPDVAKAKSLLEADGWSLGGDGIYAKDGKRLSMDVIVTSGYTDYISALDIMKQQLVEAGIEINAQQRANAEIISARGLGKFQVAIAGLGQGPVGDPYYLYASNFDSKNTEPVGKSQNPYGNVSKFSNPEVDAAIAAAGATEDIAVKKEQYFKIQSIIVPDLPYIPMLNNESFGEYSEASYTNWKILNGAGGIEQTVLGLKAK